MKKLLILLPLLFLLSCNRDDDNNDNPNPTEQELFSLNDLPSITLRFTAEDWNKFLANYDQNPKNEKKVVSRFRFTLNGNTIELDSIGLKMRGNTSRRRPEGEIGQPHNGSAPDWHHCHFGLDFSQFRNDQRFNGLNKLVLKWFKDDGNYAREIYSYDLFRRYGVWTAPRASYCRLTIEIEGDAKPAYFGVYAMIESIDEDYIARRQAKWGGGIGYLWKGGYGDTGNADFVSTDGMGVEDVKLNPTLSKYYAYDLKTREEELDAAKSELTQFITDLNNKTGSEFDIWISGKMDISLFLKTYAANVVLGMWDDYWVNANNFYFYMGADGKAYFIPYDYDNSLGTSQILTDSGLQDPLTWGNMTQRPLITRILEIPKYKALYKGYISELIDPSKDYFAKAKSIQRITAWQHLISNHVSNDTGEDMTITDRPASWSNQSDYRLTTAGGRNFFETRAASIRW